jgi:DNA-binding Lrp family transcriptional regulator
MDIDFEILKILGYNDRETFHSVSKMLYKSPVNIKSL